MTEFISTYNFIFFILLMLVLGVFNRTLEALKWNLLVAKHEEVNFVEAYKSVLVGMAFGFITPAKSGDVVGRTLCSEDKNFWVTTSLSVSSGFFQTLATLFFGFVGMIILLFSENLLFIQESYFFIALFSVLCFLLFFCSCIIFQPTIFTKIVDRFSFFRKLNEKNNFHFFNHSKREIQALIVLSFARYLVFIVQFLVAIYFCGIRAEFYLLFSLISLVFLFSTLVPSSLFGKLGVRESIALFVFSAYNFDPYEVTAASLLIWVFNQALPSSTGAILFLFHKRTNNVKA